MASGFQVMSVAVSLALFALVFTGYLTVVSCFAIIGAYTLGQLTFLIQLCRLHRAM